MNIAIFTDTYLPNTNGVAASAFTLTEELKGMGHSVYVFTGSKEKMDEWHLRGWTNWFQSYPSDFLYSRTSEKKRDDRTVHRIPSVPLSFLKPYRAATPISFHTFRLMKKLDIDIIHTQTEFMLGFLGMSMSTVFRLPVIHTYHTMYEDYTHYISKRGALGPEFAKTYSRSFCNMADVIIVPTGKTEEALKKYGVKKEIYTIPTGINLRPFSRQAYLEEDIQALKKELNIDPKWKIILSLGRVAKEKSIDQLIRHMPEIKKVRSDARLVVVGDGPELENLKLLAEELKVSDWIIFVGRVPYEKIGKYYQLGDVFVCCSTSETQGLTYYEAMAAGVPLIVRNDACIHGILKHGINAFLYEDETELPGLIIQLLDDPEITEKFRTNSAEVLEEFSAKRFALRVEDVYKNLINKEQMRKGKKHVRVSRARRKYKKSAFAVNEYRREASDLSIFNRFSKSTKQKIKSLFKERHGQ